MSPLAFHVTYPSLPSLMFLPPSSGRCPWWQNSMLEITVQFVWNPSVCIFRRSSVWELRWFKEGIHQASSENISLKGIFSFLFFLRLWFNYISPFPLLHPSPPTNAASLSFKLMASFLSLSRVCLYIYVCTYMFLNVTCSVNMLPACLFSGLKGESLSLLPSEERCVPTSVRSSVRKSLVLGSAPLLMKQVQSTECGDDLLTFSQYCRDCPFLTSQPCVKLPP